MANLGRMWAGKMYGTNTGNLSAEFEARDGGVYGVIRAMDDQYGPVVYNVRGNFDGAVISIEGTVTQAPQNVQTGTLEAKAALTPEGSLKGSWSTSLGTGGPFVLFPHDIRTENRPQYGEMPPQIHTATRTLGAIRLFSGDVQELVAYLQKDFNQGRVVATYYDRGNEVSMFAQDFLAMAQQFSELRYLKLTVREADGAGAERLAVVELTETGTNQVRVQGAQESWVVGKAEALGSKLRSHQQFLSTTFQKFGLNLNALLAFGMIIALPELPILKRILFAAVVVLASWAILGLHKRFIPNVSIKRSPTISTFWDNVSTTIISWTIAATAGVASAIVYGLLKGELSLQSLWTGW